MKLFKLEVQSLVAGTLLVEERHIAQNTKSYKKIYVLIAISTLIILLVVNNYEVGEVHVSQKTIFLVDPDRKEESPNICQTKKFRTENLFDTDKNGIPGYQRKLTDECFKENNPVKYILTLHNIWGIWNDILEKTIFDECPVKKCVVTSNRFLKPVEEFDAVLHDILFPAHLNKRTEKQLYLYLSLESPFNTYYGAVASKEHLSPGFFNMTVSYRRDSDILYPYGLIKKKKTNYAIPLAQIIQNKTKMVAWFVSNCGTADRGTESGRKRWEYVQELKKHIDIDIYGRCGTLKCPRTSNGSCYKMIEAKYMFYLSFENSHCIDYVTEKMFSVLNYNIVPVVMGGSNYNSIAPPNSVVVANDFPTPKALAEYLLNLSRNMDEYLKYFEWKKDYIVLEEPHRIKYVFCQLCDLLHRNFNSSSYENMAEWQISKSCLS